MKKNLNEVQFNPKTITELIKNQFTQLCLSFIFLSRLKTWVYWPGDKNTWIGLNLEKKD